MTGEKDRPSKSRPRVIGWREWISLPQIGVPGIKVKVDTGARTSAMHAFQIRQFRRRDVAWVSFVLHPVQRHRNPQLICEAELHDCREVTSSNGMRETRYVIRTLACIGQLQRTVQITLTDRDAMGFRMLLGREALRGELLVDARKSFSLGRFRDSDFYPSLAVKSTQG